MLLIKMEIVIERYSLSRLAGTAHGEPISRLGSRFSFPKSTVNVYKRLCFNYRRMAPLE